MPTLPAFKLEEYLDKREFTAQYMLCGSDMQTRTIQDLLAFEADAQERYCALSLDYPVPQGCKTQYFIL